ncbi:MAG TPA: hypothetical protein IAC99_01255 [Candidatus Choladocola avistercoris]|nr:hypothetical protein [Candidatus Choladocola avistercoris]
MKKILNGLAIFLLCLGLGLGAVCVSSVLAPQSESLEPIRTVEEPGKEQSDIEEEPPVEEDPEEEGHTAEKSAEEPSADSLAYSLLDEETKTVYAQMLDTLENHAEETDLPTTDEEVLPRAFEALTSDHGEIFWVSGYQYVKESLGGQTVRIRFLPSYTMTQDEREDYQAQVDRALSPFLYGTGEDDSDYEKVKTIYENLSLNVKYNPDAVENQNILSVFLGGQSVCNGIAAAAQYLLSRLDVPCMIVYGDAGGESHAWNLVMIEGDPYLMDATWGNNAAAALGACSYEYLNLTNADLAATHTADMDLELPVCVKTEFNYYVQEGLFFEAFEEDAAGAALRRCSEEGGRQLGLRFGSSEAYGQARQALVADSRIAEYCPDITSFLYMENENLHVLTLSW